MSNSTTPIRALATEMLSLEQIKELLYATPNCDLTVATYEGINVLVTVNSGLYVETANCVCEIVGTYEDSLLLLTLPEYDIADGELFTYRSETHPFYLVRV